MYNKDYHMCFYLLLYVFIELYMFVHICLFLCWGPAPGPRLCSQKATETGVVLSNYQFLVPDYQFVSSRISVCSSPISVVFFLDINLFFLNISFVFLNIACLVPSVISAKLQHVQYPRGRTFGSKIDQKQVQYDRILVPRVVNKSQKTQFSRNDPKWSGNCLYSLWGSWELFYSIITSFYIKIRNLFFLLFITPIPLLNFLFPQWTPIITKTLRS